MLASAILTQIGDVLHDSTSVRWPEAERLRWMSEAQRMIVTLKPDANSVRSVEALPTIGVARQTLPTGATTLIGIHSNMTAVGESYTPGNVIREVPMGAMDTFNPRWRMELGATVKHYMYDPRTPLVYYVYPAPISGDVFVDMTCSYVPATLTASTDALGLVDSYASVILDYVLYRAYSKDAEYAGNMALASGYYQAFQAAVGAKASGEAIAPVPSKG